MKQKFYIALSAITVFFAACNPPDDPVLPDPSTPSREANMALGNPSGATANVANDTNFLMEKEQYTLSYNRSRATANWVSWHLSKAWMGDTPRQDDFREDPNVPNGWYRVTGTSYQGSGFDRGHLCPSADRTSNINDNSATFLMTNMIPQAPDNNQITWVGMENYSRKLAEEGNELYIIAGASGQGGTGSISAANTINNGQIVVPSYIWKVAVVLPNGTGDISRISANTRVIAVKMPNNQTVDNNPWGYYRVSVDELESLTGYDFLSSVPASIQSAIEAQADNGPTE